MDRTAVASLVLVLMLATFRFFAPAYAGTAPTNHPTRAPDMSRVLGMGAVVVKAEDTPLDRNSAMVVIGTALAECAQLGGSAMTSTEVNTIKGRLVYLVRYVCSK